MDTLSKLLDKARLMCERDSDNCLAQTLGLQRAAVSKWRHGGKISPEELAKLVVLAQADPGIAVLVLNEQADDATAKKLWGPLWDRLSPVTTVIGAMVLAVTLTPATVKAKAFEINYLNDSSAYSLYIMSNIVRASL
ncbi:hypothetical protein GUF91_21175 [Xanthomonas citri pv. citri]|nr:hypothetical protein B7L66_10330 [Xanthomonas citri pv. citri]ARR17803.1 hypothetical protein B7L65_13450 [Xanthomonas citri pv. citri]ARR23703.1 hypothetical protein B7L67_20890 [Xanthomonas citri pv. citri]MBD4845838.1 hypothetical protein [Xanthomonas citri pv. citri]MBD4846079.1 hypothetical protein [Xanthomonas citri pv. citri]